MSKRSDLLKFIENMGVKDRKRQKAEDIAVITKELDYFKARRTEALKRSVEQEARGDRATAKRSRKAYNYCDKYVKHLEAILDGYKERPGKHHTKDARNRYVEAREIPKK